MNPFSRQVLFPANTRGTIGIMIACGVIFLLQLILESIPATNIGGQDILTNLFCLRSDVEASLIYRMLTYAFLHGGFLHLLFNMIVLSFTARLVEVNIGTKNFLILYSVTVYFCGLLTFLYNLLVPWAGGNVVVLGSSGAICTMLFIYWRMNPQATILLFFVLPMQIKYLMYIIITVDFIGTIFPLKTGLSHVTHLSGYILAYLYLKYAGRIAGAVENYRAARHEKIVRMNIARKMKHDRFYENRIDPILKKISEQGMESLTDIERHILKKAGKYKKEE
jgi:membrane associated rhomboid family serine protease